MKAQGMSIGVVITAALAVMVLLMVGGFMSGGFGAMTSKITGFVSSGPSAETSGGVAGCNSACLIWQNDCTNDIYKADVAKKCECTFAEGSNSCAGKNGKCTCAGFGN